MSDTKINRLSLQAEAVSILRGEIVEGLWRPGERLHERVLCERYGISRSPLREAYQVLSAEGLIDLPMNRGAIVSTPTPSRIMQYFEVLATLEMTGVRLACANATADDHKSILDAAQAMKDAASRGDLGDFFRANNSVHRQIVLASHNAPLADMHLIVARQIIRVQNLGGPLEHITSEGVGEHDSIIDALTARDTARAEALFVDHLATVGDNLGSRLKALEEAGDAA